MKILLVEDEIHKRDEIVRCVSEVFSVEPEVVGSVQGAVLRVTESDFDAIILDMALPTFGDSAADNKKGHDQAQGGIEVLRALRAANKSSRIIIVTQYPDFYIGGSKIKLKDSGRVIQEKYNQNVVGAVLYNYKSNATLGRIVSILKGLK